MNTLEIEDLEEITVGCQCDECQFAFISYKSWQYSKEN